MVCEEKKQKKYVTLHRNSLLNQLSYEITFSSYQRVHHDALAPEAEVAYLSGDLTPEAVHNLGLTGIDYNIKVFRKHPEWVEEAHRLGMNVNVWTVDKPKDIRAMQDLGVDFITTNEPALCDSIVRRTE